MLRLASAICFLGVPMTWAQHGAHVMITPSDLKWSDVPSLPPGAKIAVIEGPMNEAVAVYGPNQIPSELQASRALASGG